MMRGPDHNSNLMGRNRENDRHRNRDTVSVKREIETKQRVEHEDRGYGDGEKGKSGAIDTKQRKHAPV